VEEAHEEAVRDPIPGDLLALAPPDESLDEGDELPAKGTVGGFRDRSELDVGADRVVMGRTDSSWERRDLAWGGASWPVEDRFRRRTWLGEDGELRSGSKI
jgi:hypothetical protein